MKSYYIDSNWNLLKEKPNPNKLGVIQIDDFIDCEYLLLKNECPADMDQCPIYGGNSPCAKAIKIRLLQYDLRHSVEKVKTTQKTLI